MRQQSTPIVAKWNNPVKMSCDFATQERRGEETSISGVRICGSVVTHIHVDGDTAIAFRCDYHKDK